MSTVVIIFCFCICICQDKDDGMLLRILFCVIACSVSCSFGMKRDRQDEDTGLKKKELKSTEQNQLLNRLTYAAEEGTIEKLKECLEEGFSVNACTPDGTTALMRAVDNGRFQVVQFLCEQGADINAQNKKGFTALINAIMREDVELVKLLLANGAHCNTQLKKRKETPLMLAIDLDLKDCVPLLLAAGADVHAISKGGHTVLMSAVMNKYKDVVALLLDHHAYTDAQTEKGYTALMIAAECGSYECVQLLIHAGASINVLNKKGMSALMLAAQRGHKKVVELLIRQGADAEIHDDEGYTALMLAVANAQEDIVKLLLSHKVHINAVSNEGETALYIAADQGYEKLVELLLVHGAVVDVLGGIYKPLIPAVIRGTKKIVQCLLDAGANVNVQDENGNTALMYSIKLGYIEIALLLINAPQVNLPLANSDGITAFLLAVSLGRNEIVRVLLEKGACDLSQKERIEAVLKHAIENGYLGVIAQLIAYGVPYTHRVDDTVVVYPYRSIVQECIGQQMFADAFNAEEVHSREELKNSYKELFLFLKLFERSDVQSYLKDVQTFKESSFEDFSLLTKFKRNDLHQTMLMFAALCGHVEVIKNLLANGLPSYYINAQDKSGRTALIYTLLYGHDECAHVLIEYYKKEVERIKVVYAENAFARSKALACLGINLHDKSGNTALCYAVEKKNRTIIRNLLAAGARLTARAIKIAAEENDAQLTIELLARMSEFARSASPFTMFPALFH